MTNDDQTSAGYIYGSRRTHILYLWYIYTKLEFGHMYVSLAIYMYIWEGGLAIIAPADDLAPAGVRPSANTALTTKTRFI